MNNPYNLPDRALEQTLANGVSKGIQQAQSRQQTLDGLTNIGMALWDLSDQKKLRKLKEWVYLVIDKSCLRNPKLQDLVDLDAWVERIASQGRPTFDRIQAASDFAQKIDDEFRSLGHDVEEYLSSADYFLKLKIDDQNFQAQNLERKRLYGKASALPFATPKQLAKKIAEVVTLEVVANEPNDDIASDESGERFLITQECPTCQADVNTYDLLVAIIDWPLEHFKVLAQYHEWERTNLYGEGFSLFFLAAEEHEHLLPDARREIAILLDCESYRDFREADDVESLVDCFAENGIDLLELDGQDYSQRNDDGAITLYGIIVDETVESGTCDYIVRVSLWNGYWGLNESSIKDLEQFAFGFHSTGLFIAFECPDEYQPSDTEISKWHAIKEALAPNA